MVAERTASVKVTRSPGLNVVGSAVSESAGGPSPPLWHAWQLSVTIPPARAAAGVVRPSKSDMPSASATIDFKFGQPFCRRRLTAASVHQLLQGTVVQELILSRNWTFVDYFGGIKPQVVVGAIQANTCTQSWGICGSAAHSESNSIHSSPQTNAWPEPICTAKPTGLGGVLGKKAIGVRVLEAPPRSLTG